jgi:hypothetical protein
MLLPLSLLLLYYPALVVDCVNHMRRYENVATSKLIRKAEQRLVLNETIRVGRESKKKRTTTTSTKRLMHRTID